MILGFIILRHVNSTTTNNYWQECYTHIRKLYPENKIVIIDDDSDYSLIVDMELSNTEIIDSEFKSRGELLPYYYYLKYKWFDTAVILHDSVFIKEYIDFSTEKYKLIWHFEHNWDQIDDEIRLINLLENNIELLKFHSNKNLWKGCFGAMTSITHEYLKFIDEIHSIANLLDGIWTRYHRCSFERVFACMLQLHHTQYNLSLLGNIQNYYQNKLTYDRYINKSYDHILPMIKIWTGR